MEILNKAGIYLIFNLANQRVYIGQSKNVRRRLNAHRGSLRLGKHINNYLQNAFNKYGEDKFVFRSVEYCEIENLMIREQYWMDQFNSANPNRGYNLRPASKNESPSKETRAKIAEALKGKTHSEESRAKMGIANKGKIISEEHRSKMSEAQKGKVLSDGHRAKIGEAHKGKTRSAEARANISAGKAGRKIHSEESRAKLSAAAKLQWERKRKEALIGA